MNRVHLMMLWHMHQPQYRDPASGQYVLPWTRLHALKDYWGMVRVLEEFPTVHATFNMVPSLGVQLEEYASGKFREPWFEAAFAPAESLTPEQKDEILVRAFQVNRERLMSRWPRYLELAGRVESQTPMRAATTFGLRDWRDLQTLSQLAWMDEEYFAMDPIVAKLSAKGIGIHRAGQGRPSREADRASGPRVCRSIGAPRRADRSKFPARRFIIRSCR